MKRAFIITADAEAEITEAADWYHRRRAGLGADFRAAVRATLATVRADPLRFPLVLRSAHAALLQRFPYQITFTVDDDAVVVFACTHQRRDPQSWMDRLPV